MSALRAARVGDHGKHGRLLEGRDGAGNESARSHLTGHGEEDHLVAGGGDYRHQRPAYFTQIHFGGTSTCECEKSVCTNSVVVKHTSFHLAQL